MSSGIFVKTMGIPLNTFTESHGDTKEFTRQLSVIAGMSHQ
jgi:hypothetical protein